jgi:hypothetical protein
MNKVVGDNQRIGETMNKERPVMMMQTKMMMLLTPIMMMINEETNLSSFSTLIMLDYSALTNRKLA